MGLVKKPLVLITESNYDRLNAGVRRSDRETLGRDVGKGGSHNPMTDLTVRVCGCPNIPGSRIYPGRFVVENPNAVETARDCDRWWDQDRCEVVGANNERLVYGAVYNGRWTRHTDNNDVSRIRVSVPDEQWRLVRDVPDEPDLFPDGVSSEFNLVVPGLADVSLATWNGLPGDWALKYTGSATWEYTAEGPWTMTHDSGYMVLTGQGVDETDTVVFKCLLGSFDKCAGGAFVFDHRTGGGSPWDTIVSTLYVTATSAPPCKDCPLEDEPDDPDDPDGQDQLLCTKLASLEPGGCLLATVITAGGGCAAVVTGEANSALLQNPEDDETVWQSSGDDTEGEQGVIVTDTSTYQVLYDWPDGACCPRMRLVDLVGSGGATTTLRFLGCVDGKFRFGGHGPDLCGGTKTVCGDNGFVVEVECSSFCPNPDYDGSGWYCATLDGCGEDDIKTCVHYNDDPGDGVILCSGPHADEATCAGHCTGPVTVEVCEGQPEVSSVLHMTVLTCTCDLSFVGVDLSFFWDTGESVYKCDQTVTFGGKTIRFILRWGIDCETGDVGMTGNMTDGVCAQSLLPNPIECATTGAVASWSPFVAAGCQGFGLGTCMCPFGGSFTYSMA